MSYYYVAGLPCSNELYHHGILGQKWGVRRFQNKDGSLTAEGRIRYGGKETAGDKIKNAVSNAGRAVGSAAKKTGAAVGKATKATVSYAGKQIKKSHPSLMTDEELRDYTNRIMREKQYSDILHQQRANLPGSHALKFVGDILGEGAKTLSRAGFNKIAQEMTKSRLERENDELNQKVRKKELLDKLSPKKESGLAFAQRIMNDPDSSADDIAKASTVLKNYRTIRNNLDILPPSGKSSSSSTKSEAADFVASVISEPTAPAATKYRMRPLETMGDLGSRSGASTRTITYDPPRTGDFDSIRFIPGDPRKRRTARTSSGDWRYGYRT